VAVTGLPSFQVPAFFIPEINETIHGEFKTFPAKSFSDFMKESGTAMIVIPLICVVEQVAVAKSFGKLFRGYCTGTYSDFQKNEIK
jgi:hypothetical protein